MCVKYLARDGKNDECILEHIRQHPLDLTDTPGKWAILHQIVFNGNVDLLKDVLEIPEVHFPLNIETKDGKSLRAILEEAKAEDVDVEEMEKYLDFLQEWDAHCECAKSSLETTNNKLWAWLRRHSGACYTTPPSRKWSIGMQVVYKGNLVWLETLLNLCPPKTGEDIWNKAGRDGATMLQIAQEKGGAVLAFVQARINAANPQGSAAPTSSGKAAGGPQTAASSSSSSSSSAGGGGSSSSSSSAAGGGSSKDDPVAAIAAEWSGIKAAKILRPDGLCPIFADAPEPLFSPSRDCAHAYGKDALQSYLRTVLQSGPFPARCPGKETEVWLSVND